MASTGASRKPLELPSYGLGDEQLEFRDVLRRFLTERLPMSRVREQMESADGLALDVWREACETLGLAGLALPESEGGQGFGLAELALALAETGRALSPLPLFSVAGLVAPTISAVAREGEAAPWLARLARGEIASLAWVEQAGIASGAGAEAWSAASTTTTVDAEGRVRGHKAFVLHGDQAELFWVVAREPGTRDAAGLRLVAVEAQAPGVEVFAVETLDLTRRLAHVRFDGAAGTILASRGDVADRIESAFDVASVLLSAEMMGAMEKVLETAVDFAAERYQFGRPIGSFQAIKHKAADMLIDFESARTVTWAAIRALDAEQEEREEQEEQEKARELAKVAKAFVGPAFVRMTTENLQIHGGVGYTWEYDAHLYFRRAHSAALFLGDESRRYDWLARQLAKTVPLEVDP